MKTIFYIAIGVLIYFAVTKGITLCINGGCNTYQIKIPDLGKIEIK